MKILDKYILKQFTKTFFIVFAILFFIFILQAIWLYLPELAGKDLDAILICKFLLFKMPALVPMALPLSVVLASIMTFGDLSENYEFAAMKSAGISLQRSVYSTGIFIVFLTIATFFFANNIIPYSEYKFVNFRKNIAQKKPAMAIIEGQFSPIGNYSIKVEKKQGPNGNILKDITIHEKSANGEGNRKVIKANRGELASSMQSSNLKLVLYDGYYYEDIIPTKFEDRNKFPFVKGSFKTDIINIDLNKLNGVDLNDESVKNTDNMLNISQLQYTVDSLNRNYKKDIISFADNIYPRTGANNISKKVKYKDKINVDILSRFDDTKKLQIVKNATNNITSTIFSIDASKTDFQFKVKNMDAHWISIYFKFVIAFSCILMFFIGAPLGAIIRKGGLGLPMIFAVLIFIIFHFVNTFGKKLAEEDGISSFLGCWLSTLILGPLAIFLSYRAINDKGGTINFDVVLNPIKSFFAKILPAKKIAIKPELSQVDLYRKFTIMNNMALLFYIISLVLLCLVAIFNKKIILLMFFLGVIALYFCAVMAHSKTEDLCKLKNKKPSLILFICAIFSLPLYPLFYCYSKKFFKNDTK